MKYFDWDSAKNQKLQIERGVSFEEVIIAIENGGLLDILQHPQSKKYPNQQVLIIKLLDYVYVIPYVEDNEKYFLKTIIPSRKMTKQYLIEGRKP